MNKRALVFGVWALPALAMSCGGEPLDRSGSESDPSAPSSTEASAFSDRIMALDHDLLFGSTGDDVVAVHAYLTRYGYFPSEGLAHVYPAWRPVVEEGPASPSTYDARSVEAVKNYQAVYNIPVTGIVDAKTREMMRTPRCGWPEGLKSSVDPANKYAILDKFWGNTALWLFQGSLPRDAYMKIMSREATYNWERQTSLHFTEITTGSYDISISFGTIQCWPFVPCDPNSLAVTSPPNLTGNHSDIRVNANKPWYYGTGTPSANQYDFGSVILHEMGHAIGLDHSSLGGDPGIGTVMTPGIYNGATKRVLSVDDKVGVSSMYDQWQQMDDATRDVSVGADGEVWVIGSADNAVWKFEAGGWHRVNANASRIGVGVNGWPYVIAGWGDGSIWKRPSNWRDDSIPPGWTAPVPWVQLPGGGCAKDIGVGADGVYPDWTDAVWAIGCDSGPDGSVWKFNGSGWTPVQSGVWGNSIAVGYDGRPWITNSAGEVFHYSSNDPWSGYWELISTPVNGGPTATDIGVGAGPYPWITNYNTAAVYVLNQQPQIGDGGPSGAPWRREWRQFPAIGRSFAIAAGPNGEPWVVNSLYKLFHTIK